MTYKSLLVHADPDPDEAARLWCASDLADEFGATVIGLGAQTLAPLGVSTGGGYEASEAAWIAAQREQISANLKVAEANFRNVIGGRPNEWRTSWAAPTDAMARMARGADLIVAGGQSARVDSNRSVDVGQLITTAGRPVLLCPVGGKRLSSRSVLVAWKDTRESRRALADALPLLQRAKDVVIVEVCAESEVGCATARTHDIIEALARHGVIARPRIATKHGATAATLMDTADALGAALIVAGGYSHSRLGEWAFGGVTKALLEQDRHFVLFSH